MRLSKHIQHTILLLLCLVLFVSLLSLPNTVSCTTGDRPIDHSERVDEAYHIGLTYALKKGWQMPTDIAYILGPLAYVYSREYDPDLFWARYCWEIGSKAIVVFVFFQLAMLLPTFLLQTLLILAAIIALPRAPDAFWLFSLTAIATVGILRKSIDKYTLGSLILLLSAWSLIKPLFLIFSAFTLAGLFIIESHQRKYRTAAGFVIGYLLGLVFWWIAAKQHLANLPAYLSHAVQMTGGYVDAMATEGPLSQIVAGAIIGILLECAILFGGIRRPFDERRFCLALILAFGVFAGFKYGFTRHDYIHILNYFTYSALVIFPVLLLFKADGPGWKVFSRLALALLIVGTALLLNLRGQPASFSLLFKNWSKRFVDNFSGLVAPTRLDHRMNNLLSQAQANCSLPRIKSQVKSAPVDVVTYDARPAILNNLNWSPRPVFQSAAVYNGRLSDINRNYYDKNTAPRYVLLRLETIDHRLPTTDDGPVLLRLLCEYEPRLTEGAFALLERHLNGAASRTTLTRKTIRLGERVPLDFNSPQLITAVLNIRYSLWGQLRKFVFKPPRLFIEVEQNNGDLTSYRLVPTTAEREFLLQPTVDNQTDFLNLYKRHPMNHVRAITIDTQDGKRASFKDEIDLTVTSLSCG